MHGQNNIKFAGNLLLSQQWLCTLDLVVRLVLSSTFIFCVNRFRLVSFKQFRTLLCFHFTRCSKGKEKATPVFKHHTTKANRGIGHKTPYILNLGW